MEPEAVIIRKVRLRTDRLCASGSVGREAAVIQLTGEATDQEGPIKYLRENSKNTPQVYENCGYTPNVLVTAKIPLLRQSATHEIKFLCDGQHKF